MEFPYNIIDKIRQLHGSAKEEAKRLKEESDEAARTERLWADLHQLLEKGWPLHVVELLKKEAPRLAKMRAAENPVIPYIEEILSSRKRGKRKSTSPVSRVARRGLPHSQSRS